MNICIPVADDRGIDARLSDHFGSSPCFAFYDTDSGRLDVLDNANEHHGPGACEPTGVLATRAARAVVCRGLGRRALERLRSLGIEVFVTRETTVRQAVDAYLAGHLVAMTSDESCGGHGDCDHHHPAGS